MKTLGKISGLLALTAIIAAGPAAAYGPAGLPSHEQDATTVNVQDQRAPNGQNAPSVGRSPTAPSSVQQATTVQPGEAARAAGDLPAVSVGVSSIATDAELDATTVN